MTEARWWKDITADLEGAHGRSLDSETSLLLHHPLLAVQLPEDGCLHPLEAATDCTERTSGHSDPWPRTADGQASLYRLSCTLSHSILGAEETHDLGNVFESKGGRWGAPENVQPRQRTRVLTCW